MSTDMRVSGLFPLENNQLALADVDEDVSGRIVRDRDGRESARVKSLIVDEEERRVRFLELESGGFLGFGTETRLVPIDAVEEVGDEWIQLAPTYEQIESAPAYDPDVTEAGRYLEDLYRYYGYSPYWVGR